MTKDLRKSRRAAIGLVEVLDERIALSGVSGPIAFPVNAAPPFFFQHSNVFNSSGQYNPPGVGATAPANQTNLSEGGPILPPGTLRALIPLQTASGLPPQLASVGMPRPVFPTTAVG